MGERISRRNWILIWVLGLAGQICWNIENSWFNTFVYDKITKDPAVISWMVGTSAVVSTLAAFLIGTWSDRSGRRKPFIAVGYICWGLFTIAFGATEFLPKDPLIVAIVCIVAADAVMSFFGSTGYDAGFNAWTTDISHPRNRGKLGGALAAIPVFATIFGAVVSGMLVDAFDFFPFFTLMGGIVMLTGLASLFVLRDHEGLKAKRDGRGYWRQFADVFRIRTVVGNRELFWVFATLCVYFISFNVYFPYITIYLNNYLGMDYGTAGLLQGIGLVAAVLMTIPAARWINRGRIAGVIAAAVAVNLAGLLLVTASAEFAVLLIGIFGAGTGYILISQATVAWMKNLYPEEQRGQFEGVRMIFAVCLPMVFGPLISSFLINRYGVYMEIDGVTGMVPTEMLFTGSAIVTLLTFLPLIPAARHAAVRMRQ
jgi:MFS family permease